MVFILATFPGPMSYKPIINTVKLIVKRQDFDRTLALFLLNTAIKDLVRNYRLYTFDMLKAITYDRYLDMLNLERNLWAVCSQEHIEKEGLL